MIPNTECDITSKNVAIYKKKFLIFSENLGTIRNINLHNGLNFLYLKYIKNAISIVHIA